MYVLGYHLCLLTRVEPLLFGLKFLSINTLYPAPRVIVVLLLVFISSIGITNLGKCLCLPF